MATVISYSSIRSNLVYLVKNLSVDLLRPVMMELKLTTQEEHDKLADCRLSQQEKAEKLLISILPRKGKLGVEVFVKCLVWSGQLEAARKISVPQNVIERYLSECPHEKTRDFSVPGSPQGARTRAHTHTHCTHTHAHTHTHTHCTSSCICMLPRKAIVSVHVLQEHLLYTFLLPILFASWRSSVCVVCVRI